MSNNVLTAVKMFMLDFWVVTLRAYGGSMFLRKFGNLPTSPHVKEISGKRVDLLEYMYSNLFK